MEDESLQGSKDYIKVEQWKDLCDSKSLEIKTLIDKLEKEESEKKGLQRALNKLRQDRAEDRLRFKWEFYNWERSWKLSKPNKLYHLCYEVFRFTHYFSYKNLKKFWNG